MAFDSLKRLGGCKPLPPEVRFERSYIPEPNSGCWLWLGGERGSNGYGGIKFEGRTIPAHRYSWILHNGPIPEGLCVCHRCDIPTCVNPSHLFLGTTKENNDDKIRKGRHIKGGAHPLSKLTDGDVLLILALVGKKTDAAIARAYSVDRTVIERIRKRKMWKHI